MKPTIKTTVKNNYFCLQLFFFCPSLVSVTFEGDAHAQRGTTAPHSPLLLARQTSKRLDGRFNLRVLHDRLKKYTRVFSSTPEQGVTP